MIDYLRLMIEHAIKYKYRKKLKYLFTLRRDKEGRGADQAYANFIVHNKLVENSFLTIQITIQSRIYVEETLAR